MIIEYIRYEMPRDSVKGFIEAYARAASHLQASPNCLTFELSQGVEEPGRCIVRIEWDSVEGHERHFTSSEGFTQFIDEIRPWLAYIVEMGHYEATAVRSPGGIVGASKENVHEDPRLRSQGTRR
jgi:quinol monooxygenase YgiN